MVGKRSNIKALNNGISSLTNFGIFENFIAFIRILSSYKLGSALFNDPAITNKDFTALIPKS